MGYSEFALETGRPGRDSRIWRLICSTQIYLSHGLVVLPSLQLQGSGRQPETHDRELNGTLVIVLFNLLILLRKKVRPNEVSNLHRVPSKEQGQDQNLSLLAWSSVPSFSRHNACLQGCQSTTVPAVHKDTRPHQSWGLHLGDPCIINSVALGSISFVSFPPKLSISRTKTRL